MKITKQLVGEVEVILGHPAHDADSKDKWAILVVKQGDYLFGEPDFWEAADEMEIGEERVLPTSWPQLWDRRRER